MFELSRKIFYFYFIYFLFQTVCSGVGVTVVGVVVGEIIGIGVDQLVCSGSIGVVKEEPVI